MGQSIPKCFVKCVPNNAAADDFNFDAIPHEPLPNNDVADGPTTDTGCLDGSPRSPIRRASSDEEDSPADRDAAEAKRKKEQADRDAAAAAEAKRKKEQADRDAAAAAEAKRKKEQADRDAAEAKREKQQADRDAAAAAEVNRKKQQAEEGAMAKKKAVTTAVEELAGEVVQAALEEAVQRAGAEAKEAAEKVAKAEAKKAAEEAAQRAPEAAAMAAVEEEWESSSEDYEHDEKGSHAVPEMAPQKSLSRTPEKRTPEKLGVPPIKGFGKLQMQAQEKDIEMAGLTNRVLENTETPRTMAEHDITEWMKKMEEGADN